MKHRERNLTLEEVFVACYQVLMAANVGIFSERSSIGTADVAVYCGRPFAELHQGYIDVHNWEEAPVETMGSGQPPAKRQRIERPHPCRTCGRIFSTGQALGGHMRAHNRGANSHANNIIPIGADGQNAEVVDDTEQNEDNDPSRPSTGRPLCLNLNVKPEEEDVD